MTSSSTLTIWTVLSRPRPRIATQCVADDDIALIDRFLRTGDGDFFDILVQRYREKVFKLAASILGRGAQTEAEDATQEVVERLAAVNEKAFVIGEIVERKNSKERIEWV